MLAVSGNDSLGLHRTSRNPPVSAIRMLPQRQRRHTPRRKVTISAQLWLIAVAIDRACGNQFVKQTGQTNIITIALSGTVYFS